MQDAVLLSVNAKANVHELSFISMVPCLEITNIEARSEALFYIVLDSLVLGLSAVFEPELAGSQLHHFQFYALSAPALI